MRLIDRVRLSVPGFPQDIPTIIADEIARQIDLLPDELDEVGPSSEDLGCIAPPFTNFFVEAETTLDLAKLGERGHRITQRGLHIEVAEAENLEGEIREALMEGHRWRSRRVTQQDIDNWLAELVDQGTRWLYVMTPYIWHGPLFLDGAYQVGTDSFDTANGLIFLRLDQRGYSLDDMSTKGVDTTPFDASPYTQEKLYRYASFVVFAAKALSAMHQHTAVEHVTPNRTERRRHQREYNQPLSSYWLLKVKTPRVVKQYKDVGQPNREKGEKRAHGVHGHFRYYTPERPLFGRYSGAVWIPDHIRGKRELGEVKKDYLIDQDKGKS